MFFNQYPYLNINDLNLDFILKAIKEMRNEVTNFVSLNAVKYANPIQWDITRQYEKNTIVIDPLTGTAYISVAPVPSGVALTREDYWSVVFDLSRFIVKAAQNFTTRYEAKTTTAATFNTSEGDWLVWGDVLYVALRNIAVGELYVVDENIRHITVEEIKNTILLTIGNLEDLPTTDKSSIVSSINELLNSNIWINAAPYIRENTDITTSITSLFNIGHKYVFIPAGSYIINDLVIPEGCAIISNGAAFTSSHNPAMRLNSNTHIEGFSISNTNNEAYSSNLVINNGSDNVNIKNIGLTGCYINLYLNHASHCTIDGISATNNFNNGLCLYSDTSNNCIIKNSHLSGNRTSGSHTIQLHDGYKNIIDNCDVEYGGAFNISLTNEQYDVISNNRCRYSKAEAINIDIGSQNEIANNQCMWDDDYPATDHGITIYGSTGAATRNMIHHNFINKPGSAGIAIAGNASYNIVDSNSISNTNNVATDVIMGAITLYRDASNAQPFRNMICNNHISTCPLYAVHERDGSYQNVILDNVSIPKKSNYITTPISQLTNDPILTLIEPAITPTVTGGTLVEHTEYYIGEFVEGEFVMTVTNGTPVTYSLGIAPDSYKMFIATINGVATIPVTLNGQGVIDFTPTYSGNITVAFRYKAAKYFV